MYRRILGTAMAIFLLAIGIVCIMVLAKTDAAFAASFEIVGDKLGITIIPGGSIFNMENMAPGDTQTSTVAVRNYGDSAFSFSVDAKKENGDEALLKSLNVTVENNDGTYKYYNGPLKSLKNVELGSILPGGEEKLTLSIHFPSDIGNELQQKTLSMKLIFSAYSKESTPTIKPEDNDDTTELDDDDLPAGPVKTPKPKPSLELKPTPELRPTLKPEPTTGREPTDNRNNQTIDIEDEDIPRGTLPGTGGTPQEIYFIAGFIMILTGLKMRKR